MKWVLAIALACAACATVTTVCPTGTRLVSEGHPIKQAQYCTSQATTMAHLPTPGRGFVDTLGIANATMMSGVEGPFTRWHPNGKMAAHGTYVDLGSRSVPDGIWAFWHPSGARAMLGRFREGVPIGCFALWDEHGAPSTGIVEHGELREAPCVPPSMSTFDAIEQRATSKPAVPRADLTVAAFAGGGAFGARNAGQFEPSPSLLGALGATARLRFGPLRVGPTAGYRLSGTSGYRSTGVGVNVALGLASPHPRLDLEVAIELGVQRISATAARATQRGADLLVFWTPAGAAELGAGWRLSDTIEARLALRLDGSPAHDVDADVTYCTARCEPTVTETWQLGGFSYGAAFGFRFVL